MEEIVDVDITGPDAAWLAEFTRRLVDDRLVACGNVSPGLRSIYRWDGAVQDEPEARVALHTRRSLVPEIVERTAELHPYDVPGFRFRPVRASPAYQQWVIESTTPEA